MFLGIDPSLRQTGLALVDAEGRVVRTCAVKVGQLLGAARLALIRRRFAEFLGSDVPRAAAVEGYSVASTNRPHALGEASGVLKAEAFERMGTEPIVVAPALLKKFVAPQISDSGCLPKGLVVYLVNERWGFSAATDDEADAVVLAQIARAVVLGTFSFRREAEVVYSLGSPKPRRLRARRRTGIDNI